MISVRFDTQKAEASIRRVQQNLPGAMGRGVSRVMGRHLLPRISKLTPKPGEPLPEGAVYIRTGRLNRGWQPAAKLFKARKVRFPKRGKPPEPEGQGILQVSSDSARAIAVNLVPYALAVEIVGPAAFFGPGRTPVFKGGVRMVTKAQAELSDGDLVRREINAEWKKV